MNRAKLKSALVLWAGKHDVRAHEFALRMKVPLATASELLRGKRPFLQEDLAHFALAYDVQAVTELFKLADMPADVEVEALQGPEDARIVPILKTRVSNVGISRRYGTIVVSPFSKN